MHSFEKKSRLHIALCALSLLAACASDPIGEEAPQPVGEPSQETAATGRLRVKFKQGEVPERIIETRSGLQTGSEPLDRAIAALGVTRMQRVFPPAGRFEARTRRAGLDRWYDVWFDSLRSVTRATLDLSRLEGIECVEPVYAIRSIGPERAVAAPLPAATRTASLPFDDPGLAKQWHYSNDGSMPDAVAGADINLFRAWEVTAGSNDVVVAVVDGGIDYAHEDLIGNVGNWAELYGEEGVDDDGNGYVDDIYGWNFIYSSAYPMGSNRITPVEHGTHVAGTIAAENGNGIGVCGVAGGRGGHSGVRVISCQMFTENRNDNGDEIVALKYGADAGAVISQNSWGYTNVYEMPEITKDAIDYFIEYAGLDENGVQVGPMKGGIVIFAAGNEECDYRSYPACYERVLSVSALAPDYRKSYYSNFSPLRAVPTSTRVVTATNTPCTAPFRATPTATCRGRRWPVPTFRASRRWPWRNTAVQGSRPTSCVPIWKGACTRWTVTIPTTKDGWVRDSWTPIWPCRWTGASIPIPLSICGTATRRARSN